MVDDWPTKRTGLLVNSADWGSQGARGLTSYPGSVTMELIGRMNLLKVLRMGGLLLHKRSAGSRVLQHRGRRLSNP